MGEGKGEHRAKCKARGEGSTRFKVTVSNKDAQQPSLSLHPSQPRRSAITSPAELYLALSRYPPVYSELRALCQPLLDESFVGKALSKATTMIVRSLANDPYHRTSDAAYIKFSDDVFSVCEMMSQLYIQTPTSPIMTKVLNFLVEVLWRLVGHWATGLCGCEGREVYMDKSLISQICQGIILPLLKSHPRLPDIRVPVSFDRLVAVQQYMYLEMPQDFNTEPMQMDTRYVISDVLILLGGAELVMADQFTEHEFWHWWQLDWQRGNGAGSRPRVVGEKNQLLRFEDEDSLYPEYLGWEEDQDPDWLEKVHGMAWMI